MTRKDYQVIADSFAFGIYRKEELKESSVELWGFLELMKATLARNYVNFDADKFEKAIHKKIKEVEKERKEIYINI